MISFNSFPYLQQLFVTSLLLSLTNKNSPPKLCVSHKWSLTTSFGISYRLATLFYLQHLFTIRHCFRSQVPFVLTGGIEPLSIRSCTHCRQCYQILILDESLQPIHFSLKHRRAYSASYCELARSQGVSFNFSSLKGIRHSAITVQPGSLNHQVVQFVLSTSASLPSGDISTLYFAWKGLTKQYCRQQLCH